VQNNFVNNLSDLLLDVSDRETRWSDESGGNHWSGYQGYDLDRDGIGDVAFDIQNVFQVMEGEIPEIRFYLFSPAAEVLRAAERALPILRSSDAEDPRPLIRAAENEEVPWREAGAANMDSSFASAFFFLLLAILPAATVIRFQSQK